MRTAPKLTIAIDPDPAMDRDNDDTLNSTYRHEGLSIGENYLRCPSSGKDINQLSQSLANSIDARRNSVGNNVIKNNKQTFSIDRNLLQEQNLVLGRGVCSEVVLAKNIHSQKLYALKKFNLRSLPKRNMLHKEIGFLRSVMDCDCLVGLEGGFFDKDTETVTIILEYMDRRSLADFIAPNSKGLPEQMVAAIAYQMIIGVGYLHHENYLHRDIKPANVLMNSKGEVKLTDFGISSSTKQGLADTVVGTKWYMSIERLKTQPYGSPSDIWSLGLVLLECYLGRSPFQNISSEVDLYMTITSEDPRFEDEFLHEIPSQLQNFISLCLKREPQDRASASELFESEWFRDMGVNCLDDACLIMKEFLDSFDDTKYSGGHGHIVDTREENDDDYNSIQRSCLETLF